MQTQAAGCKYIKNYTFPYKLPPNPQAVHFTVTAVLGHVNDRDFGDAHRKWHSCPPFALFDAEIHESLSSVCNSSTPYSIARPSS